MTTTASKRLSKKVSGKPFPLQMLLLVVQPALLEPHKDYTSRSRAESSRCEGWKLMDRQGRPSFTRGDPVSHRPLPLLKGAHFDLAHALARDAELGRQVLKRDRIIRQAARLEDAPLPVVEHAEGFAQGLAAVVRFLALGEPRLLVGDFVDQALLPFPGLTLPPGSEH